MSDSKPREAEIAFETEAYKTWRASAAATRQTCPLSIKVYEQVHMIEYSSYELEKQKRNEAVELCSKMEQERDEARAEAAEHLAAARDGIDTEHLLYSHLTAERARSAKLMVTLKRVLAWARDKHELPHYSEMLYDAEAALAAYAKDTSGESSDLPPYTVATNPSDSECATTRPLDQLDKKREAPKNGR